MSQNLSQHQLADPTLASVLLESLRPGLSSAVLEAESRPKESLDTVLFAFNPWQPFVNFSLQGFRFGIQIPIIPRMELIPLKVWRVPDIQPRVGGFAVGSITTSGAFPSGSVGSVVKQQFQFPSESAKKLIAGYGADSTNNIGMIVFRSLGGDNDKDKLESILLFRAVMERPVEGRRGVDLLLEELPKFLKEVAPQLLARACATGVDIGEEDTVKLSAVAQHRGEVMIADLRDSIAAATRAATDETTGILTITKRELIQAGRGQKDVKLVADDRDNWLLNQFPGYKMDTDVERSMRATQGIAEAISKSGENQELTLKQLITMNERTIEQLALANDLNRQLMSERTAPVPPAA